MKRLLVAMVLCSFVAVPAAHAGGFYLGGSVGSSSADFDQPGNTRVNFDAVGYKLFAGYGIIRFFAVEVGYTDLGNPSESFGNESFDLDMQLGAVWAIGILPATPKLSLYGRLGYSAWDAELISSVPLDKPYPKNGNDLAFGFGISYNITRRLGVQLEWENYEVESAKEVTFGSFGVRWTF
ncbi:MAG: outer membrane beta-barrel protein [Deltaproteobacteria bacterium]|nr:outer membrane beta-barrel protein [Deltaproteobacteria bacterium]